MAGLATLSERLQDFLIAGGPILRVLIVVIAIMWVLIFERLIYVLTVHRCKAHDELARFALRTDRESWQSERIYEGLISQLRMQLERGDFADAEINFRNAIERAQRPADRLHRLNYMAGEID